MIEERDRQEIIDILNKFWLLDVNEYSIIKDLIKSDIERYEENVKDYERKNITHYIDLYNKNEIEEGSEIYDDIRHYYQDKNMVAFYIVMKSKIEYIISKGLYKQNGV